MILLAIFGLHLARAASWHHRVAYDYSGPWAIAPIGLAHLYARQRNWPCRWHEPHDSAWLHSHGGLTMDDLGFLVDSCE